MNGIRLWRIRLSWIDLSARSVWCRGPAPGRGRLAPSDGRQPGN